MSSRPRKRRWLRWLAAACGLLVLAGAAGAAYLASSQPGDVVNEDVEFDATPPPAPAPEPEAGTGSQATGDADRGERRGVSSFTWPMYGYDKARTKYLPLAEPLRPPFAERWKLGGSILLEFPPAMGGRSLFLLKNNGALYGISRRSGEVRWKRKLGYLAASQPAYGNGVVYSVLLQRGKGV